MKKRQLRTVESFKQEFYDLVGNEYTLLSNFSGVNNKIKIKHNLCGNEYEQRTFDFLRGNRCKFCAIKISHQKQKKTTEQFKQEVYDLVGDEYTVLGEYINNSEKILIKHNCNNCNNYQYLVRPNDFLNKNNRCPYCSGKKKKTTEEFKQEVYDLVGDEYTVLGEYINNSEKILIKHNTCKNEYKINPKEFISGNRCPYCSGKKKKTTEEFKQEVLNLTNNEYIILNDIEYTSNKNYIKIKHIKCNNTYLVTPHNFITTGNRCPFCSKVKKFSNTEKEILEYISKIYNLKVIENDRTILNGKELDIYIPDKKLAIEIDGLYWHSYENMRKTKLNFSDLEIKNYHLNKTIQCQEKGIRLIHIFEDEWILKQDIVKDHIQNLLGITPKKISYRKCYIDEITNEEKKEFLNSNHIQGNDSSSIKLGMFYPEDDGDRLVAVMTFRKPSLALGQNSNSKYDYELSRFAVELGTSIYMGFHYMFKYFKEHYEWNRIITYADRRWSEGNLYLKNEFTFLHNSKPNYWYFKRTKSYLGRTHRFAFRKQVLKTKFPEIYSENKTEKEIMLEADYMKIYDCGNIIFEYNLERNNLLK